MAPGSRKAAVELVESGELDLEGLLATDEELGPAAGAPPPTGSGWRRAVRRAWPLALVAVVVVGAVAVSSAREAARVEARRDVLRGQMGFVEGVGSEMGWRWATELAASDYVVAASEGVLLLGSDDGRQRVLDLETGEELWAIGADGDLLPSCGVDGAMMECAFWASMAWDVDDPTMPRASRVERRDARSGEVLDVRDPAAFESLVWWDDDLLLLEDVDGALELRLEAPGGEVRWRLPVPRGGAGSRRSLDVPIATAWVDQRAGLAFVRTDRHLVVDREGRIVLELVPDDEGRESGEWLGSFLPEVLVRSRWAEESQQVELLDLEGRTLLDTDGYFSSAMVDDGVVPHLVVVAPPWGLEVLDWSTGRSVIELDGAPEGLPLLLHGALISQERGEIRAVDLATGDERWHADVPGDALGSDGEVVLYADRGLESRIRAISVHTGAEVWTYDLPSSQSDPFVRDGALFVRDGTTLTRLGTGG